jgi:threonine/homoserine/homoserine lactone efflux protein
MADAAGWIAEHRVQAVECLIPDMACADGRYSGLIDEGFAYVDPDMRLVTRSSSIPVAVDCAQSRTVAFSIHTLLERRPGPATLLTVARATSTGTKVGIATGAGIAAGDVLHIFMAIIGISAIIAASATLFSIVKYLGAAYLVYLGIQAIVAKTPFDPTAARALPITAQKAFRQANLAEVLNPKTALFFLAFLPQFVHFENGAVALQLTILGIVFVLLGLLSTVVFAVSAGSLDNFLRRNPTVLKWQGKVVGGIYCALGVRLAFQER